jgi:hypothetical protein
MRRNREDRLMVERGIEQVTPATLETRCADPAANARPFALEQLVEIPRRDEVRVSDPLRIKIGIAEIRLDERLDLEQEVSARLGAQPMLPR